MKRPLWCFGCVFSATLLVISCFPADTAVYLGILCFFLCVPVFLLPLLRRNAAVWATLLAVTTACICFVFHQYRTVKPLAFPTEKILTLTVQTEEITQMQEDRIYRFVVLNGDLPTGTTISGRPAVDSTFSCSDWQTVSGTFKVISSDSPYDNSRNIWLRATPMSVTIDDAVQRPWYAVFSDARAYASRLLHRYLNNDLASLTQAIGFGQKDLLSDEIETAFSATGLSHLLVTSGMHVAILSQAILAFLKKMGLPRRKAAILACLPVLLIMGLCGFGYSVMRAGIMQIILLLAHISRRESDGLNSLGGAMLLILFCQPYAVSDIGLWLSFGTTAGILFFHPLVMSHIARVRFRLIRYLLSTLSVTLCATVPVLPILAIYFNKISLISPLSNLLICFISSPMLLLTYLAVGISWIPGLAFLVEGLLFLVGLLAQYLSQITMWLAQIPYACVPIAHPIISVLLIGALLSLWLFAFFEKKKGILTGFLCSAILFLCGFAVCTVTVPTTTVTALNIGDGTALLLQKADQTALVLSTDSTEALNNTTMWLRQQNIERLDILILPDTDDSVAAVSYSSLTDVIPAKRQIRADSTQKINDTLWDGLTILEYDGGWIRFDGDFSLLLIPPNAVANVETLPVSWRENDLVVFNRNVPWHFEQLTAQKGILCCEDAYVSFWSVAFKDVPYKVDVNTKDTVLTISGQYILS